MPYRSPAPLAALAVLGTLALGACETATLAPPPLETRTIGRPIVNGTRDPQAVALDEGEILAIGWLHRAGRPSSNFCTGTLIAPRVVATASHCTAGSDASDIGFGVGLEPTDPVASFRVTALYEHPSVDAALLVLGSDATETVPGLVPIPANDEDIDSSRIGEAVQAGGYGETRDRSRTGRWFATVYLLQVGNRQIRVDGRGEQGICYGDSGGPVIAENSAGEPRVLGVESYGDNSCVDVDTLTRLDAIMDWITPVLEGDAPFDPCDGLDFLGRCTGNVAEWCENGELRQRDCDALGTSCSYVNDRVGYICDCGDLDFYGRCDGDLLEYCDNGRFVQRNCQARGQVCGLGSPDEGYVCTNEAACSAEDAAGRCDGDTAVNCSDGRVFRDDCGELGLTCVEAPGRAICDDLGGADAGADVGGGDMGADLGDDLFPGTLDAGFGDEGGGVSAGGSASGAESGCSTSGAPPSPLAALAILAVLFSSRQRRTRRTFQSPSSSTNSR